MAYPGATPVTPVDKAGNVIGGQGASVSSPSFERVVGAPNVAMGQAATSISNAAATLLVAARAGRQSVTLTNITGSQIVYLVASAVTTGATTGFPLAAAPGAAVTIQTAAAIYGTSPTAAQTVGVLETF